MSALRLSRHQPQIYSNVVISAILKSMQENSRYAVGIDIGTVMVRCVVGYIDSTTGIPTIVGVGESANSGMRKGVVVNLSGPAQAIDNALGDAERMSGHEVNAATISINGAHILSTKTDGMIAAGSLDHEIVADDLRRIEEVATVGKVPANRQVLEFVPHTYCLDGQDNIKDPIGMSGTRLEINANVISALGPHVANTQKAAEMATVQPRTVVASVIAAAKAVLNERQTESGVAVIDIGGATSSVAVFEEGDLQYVGIVPLGGVNITNDLAIGLKVDPEVAEKIKLAHAHALPRGMSEVVTIEHDEHTYSFGSLEIDEIVEARLEEIIEAIEDELKKSGRNRQLPSGVVLTGGTVKMPGMVDFAKQHLGVAARIGQAAGYSGVAEQAEEPYFATAVGLMLIDVEAGLSPAVKTKNPSGFNQSVMLKKFLGRFKV